MRRIRLTAAIGLATGIVGVVLALLPFVSALEDSIGLHWLFRARGPLPAPDGVAIVSIDEASAAAMGLPRVARDWPRSTHATVVDNLVEHGASAIAFDLQFFAQGQPDADRAFAESIARSRRVVLIQRLDRVLVGGHEIWEQQNPIPVLASGAVALAPVPIPDAPSVSWIWSFLHTPTGGDLPTLPAVLLQFHAMPVMGRFLDAVGRAGVPGVDSLPRLLADVRESADLLRLMQTLRTHVRTHPSVSRGIADAVAREPTGTDSAAPRVLTALADLYTGNDTRYLNFYGPPGRICTIPYDAAHEGSLTSACPLEGAVVFVGQGAARDARAGQLDTYYTPYRGRDGIDFSGVEIQATAFANLLGGTALRPLGLATFVATLMTLGALLAGGTYWVRTRSRQVKGAVASRAHAAAFAVGVAAAYCAAAYVCFRDYYTIVPVVVPLLIQLPTALVLSLLSPAARRLEQVRAVCLMSDAGGSTALGQRLQHASYADLMLSYRDLLFGVARQHGGTCVPPEGDGFLCIWCSPATSTSARANEAMRLQACVAALQLEDAANEFNLQHPGDQRLPTRIGLNVGTVTIEWDADRGISGVTGDSVNVAKRLCDLNVEIGTHVLVSGDVAAGLEGKLVLRRRSEPGEFPMKGVARPPAVFELVGRTPLTGSLIGEVETCSPTRS